MERTPDTSPVWWKIVICKHHPHLQTQTHEMQTVASCVKTFGLVMHEICWNVAFRDLNLQSESTPLLVGSVAASGLPARALQQTLFRILLLFCYCLSWRAADLPFLILHLHALMARSIYLGYGSYFKPLYSSYQIQNRLFKHFKCFVWYITLSVTSNIWHTVPDCKQLNYCLPMRTAIWFTPGVGVWLLRPSYSL